MDVVKLSEGKFSVTAHAEPDGDDWVIPLVDFLDGLEEKQFGGMVNGVFALFDHFAEVGTNISKDLCHLVDKDEGIYEFIKGDLRILWFYAKGNRGIVICSHGFLKKGQKTPNREKKTAIQLKKEYESGGKSLNIIKEQDTED
jgi:hypothetical protein